jgi:hypothetical protein
MMVRHTGMSLCDNDSVESVCLNQTLWRISRRFESRGRTACSEGILEGKRANEKEQSFASRKQQSRLASCGPPHR